jgi:hypothetical protein
VAGAGRDDQRALRAGQQVRRERVRLVGDRQVPARRGKFDPERLREAADRLQHVLAAAGRDALGDHESVQVLGACLVVADTALRTHRGREQVGAEAPPGSAAARRNGVRPGAPQIEVRADAAVLVHRDELDAGQVADQACFELADDPVIRHEGSDSCSLRTSGTTCVTSPSADKRRRQSEPGNSGGFPHTRLLDSKLTPTCRAMMPDAQPAAVLERVARSRHGAVIFDAARLPECPQSWFTPRHWHERDAVRAQAKGRGTAWLVDTPAGRLFLRHYHRGGLVARANGRPLPLDGAHAQPLLSRIPRAE